MTITQTVTNDRSKKEWGRNGVWTVRTFVDGVLRRETSHGGTKTEANATARREADAIICEQTGHDLSAWRAGLTAVNCSRCFDRLEINDADIAAVRKPTKMIFDRGRMGMQILRVVPA